jgi:hypothetical protein
MMFIEKVIKGAGRGVNDLRWVIVIVAAVYIVGYFALSPTPGNSPYAHPLGWWGWFDQGQYLKSAYALLQLDFSPDKHFYPPLYPAVGGIFLAWSSGHPFFLLNLICLLWFAYVFIRVADRYIPRWGSVLVLFGTTIFNFRIFENYLIPWTTTLSAALLATGILGMAWLQDVMRNEDIRISGWQVFIVAACLGLLVPTRPGDAVVGGLLGLGLSLGYWHARRFATEKMPRPTIYFSLAIIGFAIGPAIYFGFNKAVFGTFAGGYMQVSEGNGFFLADLAEKFVSLWLDGETLYGEPNTGLVQRYPWLLFSLAGLVWVLLRGDFFLRVLAVAICGFFVIYMSYGDLLPNGLWRYLNIHYFKWTFPFLGLFAWLLIEAVLAEWHLHRGWRMPIVVSLAIPGILLTLHLSIHFKPLETGSDADRPIYLTLPHNEIDVIDVKGVAGGFNEVYFGEHRVLLDGKELKRVRDYRLLPLGSDIRLLFIRPISGQSIEFTPDKRLVRHDGQISAYGGEYGFALGLPMPFRKNVAHQMAAGYRIGDVVDFSTSGNSQIYSSEGWSYPEDWGRWSMNKEARLVMRISEYTGRQLMLELTYGALVHKDWPCQKVVISGNGRTIGSQDICLESNGGVPKPYLYTLPEKLLAPEGELDVRISTPNSVSPRQLGINDDPRVLGIGLKTLRIFE